MRGKLGWGVHYDAISSGIFNFKNMTPHPNTFAQAVAKWQSGKGLPANGILNATTWREMLNDAAVRAQLASMILSNKDITLATVHESRKTDNATARQNIEDTSNRLPASRSSYKTAPGGTVLLDIRLLLSILELANRFSFAIAELAGGEHSRGSRHYAGVTMDVNIINGQHVSARHPGFRSFMRTCRGMGATQVLGPGDPDHHDHIHCAW